MMAIYHVREKRRRRKPLLVLSALCAENFQLRYIIDIPSNAVCLFAEILVRVVVVHGVCADMGSNISVVKLLRDEERGKARCYRIVLEN